uniref:Uncharacterized protein n=1 Tax=Arundo donax TaxID=35708 RepID=A0A0A8ZHZ1_ARUDO
MTSARSLYRRTLTRTRVFNARISSLPSLVPPPPFTAPGDAGGGIFSSSAPVLCFFFTGWASPAGGGGLLEHPSCRCRRSSSETDDGVALRFISVGLLLAPSARPAPPPLSAGSRRHQLQRLYAAALG